MKRFVFRESKLLALRKQQVRLAEIDLARRVEQMTAAREAVDRHIHAIDELSERVMNQKENGFVHITQTALGFRARLEEANETLIRYQQELAAARERFRRIKTVAESLQSLHDAKYQEYTKDRESDLQEEMDANVTRRWTTEQHNEDD